MSDSERFDVVVIGAGTAGLPCALEAAEAGARVLLLEKAGRIGGTLHVSGGHMSAGGTRIQREHGIDDSIEEHWQDVLRISHGTVDRRLARRAVELAPSMIDWLQQQGFEFADDCPRIVYGHEPYRIARTVYGVDEARSLLALFERKLQPFIEMGTVTVQLNARAGHLLVERGALTGVGYSSEGAERTALASAVVLATGGYAANAELFERLDGRPLVSSAEATSTGDGVLMAEALGAAITGHDKFLPTFGGLPHPDDPSRAQWADRPLLVAAERDPWEIWVDSKGRRWLAEDHASMHEKEEALAELPDLTFHLIFDDRAPDESPNLVVGWSAEKLRSAANAREGIVAADSIGALAERMEVDGARLAETIARYNRMVEDGCDVDFGRRFLPAPIERPPFYAMRNHGISLLSFCGLEVSDELAVRSADGSVIEGLFAVGEVLGAGAFCGRSFVGGMMVGPAIALGRELGSRIGREQKHRRQQRHSTEERTHGAQGLGGKSHG